MNTVAREPRPQARTLPVSSRVLPEPAGEAGERRCGIVLIDDHPVVRAGVRAIVSEDPGMTVLGEAPDAERGCALVAQLQPEIAIVDITMPGTDGVEVCRTITRDHPGTRVLGLSMHGVGPEVQRMLNAGARGCIRKDRTPEEIRGAIRSVLRGDRPVEASNGKRVADSKGDDRPPASLAPREREVLHLMAEGLTSAQIAAHLGLSTYTVDTHRRNIARKTGTRSVAKLTKLALREGLTSM